MKSHTLSKAILASAMFVALGSAQAGMLPCPLGGSNAGCGNQPGAACPRPESVPNSNASCAQSNQELPAMLGNMAAGGLQIASTVMGALVNQAGKVLGPNQ